MGYLATLSTSWVSTWTDSWGETHASGIGLTNSDFACLQYYITARYSEGTGSKRRLELGLQTASTCTGNANSSVNSAGTVYYAYKKHDASSWSGWKSVSISPIWTGKWYHSSTTYGQLKGTSTFEIDCSSAVDVDVKFYVSGGSGSWDDTFEFDCSTWTLDGGTASGLYFRIPAKPSYTVSFDKYLDGSTYTGSDITLDRTSYTAYDTSSTTTCTTDTTNSAKYSFSGWFKGSNTSASWTAKTTGSINASSNSGSTYHAKWTTNTYTVSSTTYTDGVTSTSGGNISISSATVAYGGSSTLTATVNSGYRFLGWYSTSTGAIIGGSTDRLATTLSYTLSSVTSNTTLYPSFISRYTIETLTVPLAGGTVSGTTEVDRGGSTTLTATPNEHYEFIGWSIGYDDTAPTVFSNPLELTNITEDKFVFAYFMYLLSIKRRIISG